MSGNFARNCSGFFARKCKGIARKRYAPFSPTGACLQVINIVR